MFIFQHNMSYHFFLGRTWHKITLSELVIKSNCRVQSLSTLFLEENSLECVASVFSVMKDKRVKEKRLAASQLFKGPPNTEGGGYSPLVVR